LNLSERERERERGGGERERERLKIKNFVGRKAEYGSTCGRTGVSRW